MQGKNGYGHKGRLRRLMTAVAGIILAICICLPAAASDSDVVFEPDPEGAEKAHVYVGAIVEEGCTDDITLELYPTFPEGTVHRYVLTAEEGYLNFDDVMVGEYDAVAYMTNAESSMSATYIGGTQEVAKGKGAPYFAAVGGSASFVSEYGWLSSYAIEKGTMLSGETTEDEAKALFEETIAMQGMPEESIKERPELAAAAEEAEKEAQASAEAEGRIPSEGTGSSGRQEQASHENINEGKETPEQKTVAPVFIGAGLVLAAIVAGTVYYRRRRSQD